MSGFACQMSVGGKVKDEMIEAFGIAAIVVGIVLITITIANHLGY